MADPVFHKPYGETQTYTISGDEIVIGLFMKEELSEVNPMAAPCLWRLESGVYELKVYRNDRYFEDADPPNTIRTPEVWAENDIDHFNQWLTQEYEGMSPFQQFLTDVSAQYARYSVQGNQLVIQGS